METESANIIEELHERYGLDEDSWFAAEDSYGNRYAYLIEGVHAEDKIQLWNETMDERIEVGLEWFSEHEVIPLPNYGKEFGDNEPPVRYSREASLLAQLGEEGRIKREETVVAVESTEDYTDLDFHSELANADIRNPDGSYGHTVELYRLVMMQEDGKIVPYETSTYYSVKSVRREIEENGLREIPYDDLIRMAHERRKTKMNTVIVNMFAGPGAGKTTTAWAVASELKKKGVLTEYVGEYAKELVWEGKTDRLDGTLEHQKALFLEQRRRIDRLVGKVEVVVTDAPILLNLSYLKGDGEAEKAYDKTVTEAFCAYENFNVFIKRGQGGWEQEGRIHTEEQSRELDGKIQSLLDERDIYYCKYSGKGLGRIADNVITTYNRLNAENIGFYLPKKAEQNSRVYANLASKGISTDTIFAYIRRGLLYESQKYHNCVFVCRDEQGEAKGAILRGTLSNKAYSEIMKNSAREYGVTWKPEDMSAATVCVYDDPVRMMREMDEKGLSGVYNLTAPGDRRTEILERFFQEHPHVNEVGVFFQEGREECRKELEAAGKKVVSEEEVQLREGENSVHTEQQTNRKGGLAVK